jgi:hypothetical protein
VLQLLRRRSVPDDTKTITLTVLKSLLSRYLLLVLELLIEFFLILLKSVLDLLFDALGCVLVIRIRWHVLFHGAKIEVTDY